MKKKLKLSYLETCNLLKSPTRSILIERNKNYYEVVCYFKSKVGVAYTALDVDEYDTISYNKKAFIDCVINALKERKKNER